MVDREVKTQMAVLLRHLAIGRITTKQFDTALETLPFSGEDRVFDAIFEETFRIETAPRREVARWILFLHSEAEYVWPGIDEIPSPLGIIAVAILAVILANVLHNPAVGWYLTIGGYILIKIAVAWLGLESRPPGEKDAWPFLCLADLAEARRHPRLLNGKRAQSETIT